MKLYKYVPSERIDILLNCYIRFSQLEVLNDPFELQPFYKDHTEKNPFKLLHEFSILINNYQKRGQIPTKEQIENYEKERKRITKDDIYKFLNKNIVGLSLTEDKENLLMWSHYASNYAGFVIELDTTKRFFHGPNKYLFKVDYGLERPRVNTIEFANLIVNIVDTLNQKQSIPKEIFEKISETFKKGLDWQYEKEWRLISIPKNAINYSSFEKDLDTIFIGGDISKHQFKALFPLPLDTISGIYVGERIKKETLRKLFLLIKNNSLYNHIKLVKTKINDQNFKLDFSNIENFDVLKLEELNVDFSKTSKWKRILNPYINSYYKEVQNLKNNKPAGNN